MSSFLISATERKIDDFACPKCWAPPGVPCIVREPNEWSDDCHSARFAIKRTFPYSVNDTEVERCRIAQSVQP